MKTPITYEQSSRTQNILVRLDGKRVGTIVDMEEGWCYKPIGGDPGRCFPTLEGAKRSIEGKDEELIETVHEKVEDLVHRFLWDDRKGDEDLSVQQLKAAFEKKIITPEELAEKFLEKLKLHFP